MDKPTPEPRGHSLAWTGAFQTWTPAVTSLAALGLSIYNLLLFREPPQVEVSLPSVLRIGQQSNVVFFIQPTLTAPNKTEDLEIITKVELKMQPKDPADSSARARFWWNQLVAFEHPPESGYKHADDPTPIVISQDKPQKPVFSFVAEDWKFKAVTYEGILTFHRRSNKDEPRVEKFCLVISDDDVKEFAKATESNWWWYPYRNDDPGGRDRHGDCYARWDGY
ncbi:hypothetical protein ABT236_32470 [Streptomyces sp. NPDC001523]|uniref:hypothetical protein n=1 Tax=Streptomyces sp. NPDC001523 TaxID=3154383 RepID=UPI00331FCA95